MSASLSRQCNRSVAIITNDRAGFPFLRDGLAGTLCTSVLADLTVGIVSGALQSSYTSLHMNQGGNDDDFGRSHSFKQVSASPPGEMRC